MISRRYSDKSQGWQMTILQMKVSYGSILLYMFCIDYLQLFIRQKFVDWKKSRCFSNCYQFAKMTQSHARCFVKGNLFLSFGLLHKIVVFWTAFR